jgi:hypothetical protein
MRAEAAVRDKLALRPNSIVINYSISIRKHIKGGDRPVER